MCVCDTPLQTLTTVYIYVYMYIYSSLLVDHKQSYVEVRILHRSHGDVIYSSRFYVKLEAFPSLSSWLKLNR